MLAIGMAIAIAGSTMVVLAPATNDIRTAMIIVALLLMAAGYAGVANRVTGWQRTVMRLVAGLQLAWLGWLIVRPHVELDDWHYTAIAAVWWSGIALLTVAARAWWSPASPWVVVAAVIAVVLEGLPVVMNLEPWTRPVRELVTSGTILVLVRGVVGWRHAVPAGARGRMPVLRDRV